VHNIILNHSKSWSIKTVVSLLCISFLVRMTWNTTVLIDLLWFNVVHYSSLFQYFFQSTMVPTLVENFNVVHYSSLFQYFFSIYYGPYSSWKFLMYLFASFFGNTIMIEIQYRGSSREFKRFHEPSFLPGSDRPLPFELITDLGGVIMISVGS